MMSSLTEEQKQRVLSWIEQKMDLSEIQKRLRDEFGVGLTYLETRLLLDDLKVVIKEEEPEPPLEKLADSVIEEDKVLEPDNAGLPLAGGRVSVTVDQITKPNSLISGKVTFSDGQKADWVLDSMGRLALNPETPGYRPTQHDVMDFQMELQRVARF